jgi:hypothetical protein
MEPRSRWRWISVVSFSHPVGLKFSDEDLQFLFPTSHADRLGADSGGGAETRHIRRSLPTSSIISARDLAMRISQMVDQPRSWASVRFRDEYARPSTGMNSNEPANNALLLPFRRCVDGTAVEPYEKSDFHQVPRIKRPSSLDWGDRQYSFRPWRRSRSPLLAIQRRGPGGRLVDSLAIGL